MVRQQRELFTLTFQNLDGLVPSGLNGEAYCRENAGRVPRSIQPGSRSVLHLPGRQQKRDNNAPR